MPMPASNTSSIAEKLDELRTELVDLAFNLECKGQLDAADVAITASVRVGELCDELALVDAGLVETSASSPR